MKILGFKKYLLLLMLSFGIAKGSFASVSKTDLLSTKKSTNLQLNNAQLNLTPTLLDLIEETDDSDDVHFSFDFTTPPDSSFTFRILQKEAYLVHRFLSSQPFNNQKIIVLNCTYLI